MKSRQLLLAILIGACLAAITWFVPDPFLHLLNTPARLMSGWLGLGDNIKSWEVIFLIITNASAWATVAWYCMWGISGLLRKHREVVR